MKLVRSNIRVVLASVAVCASVAVTGAAVLSSSSAALAADAACYTNCEPPPPATGPSAEATAAVAAVLDGLPAGTSAAVLAAVEAQLASGAAAFAAAGLSPAQQAQAVAVLGSVLTDSRLTGNVAALNAVSSAMTQAFSLLGAGGLAVFSPGVVSNLVGVLAGALTSGKVDGPPAGLAVSTRVAPDGSVEASLNGFKPNTPVLLIVSVTDAAVGRALIKAFGANVVSAHLDASGRGTLVLSGTADELGRLKLAVPPSALGASDAATAAAAMAKTVFGVVGTSANGTSAVFATNASSAKPAVPTVATASPIVTPGHPAVVAGNAQPGTTVQLLGRSHTGEYRVLRTFLVGPVGRYAFVVFPTENTRFITRSTLDGQSTDSSSTVINIRPSVSQRAVATAKAHTYRFAGSVRPAPVGTLVNLYRNGTKGSVLVAQTRTLADGSWSIVRTFVGSGGTFNFFARSAATGKTIGGTSPVQRIAIQ